MMVLRLICRKTALLWRQLLIPESWDINDDADRPRVIHLGEAMMRSKANALRSAIYQTREDTEELSTVKAQMIQVLKQIEEDLINQFVRESYGYRLIG